LLTRTLQACAPTLATEEGGWDAIGDASAFHRLLSGGAFSDVSEPNTMTQEEIDATSDAYASSVRIAVSTLRLLWNETRIRLAQTRSGRHRSATNY